MRMRRIGAGATLLACLAAPSHADGTLPELSPEELIELAKSTYRGESCWWERVEEDIGEIRSWEISFRYDYEEEDGPDRAVRLYQLPCFYGAYNFSSIWFMETELDGLGPVHFATPELDIDYADDESAVVEKLTVLGFTAVSSLFNAWYDEDTQTISSFSKWRGIADAASSGTWTFHDGRFVLTEYQADASYDGEINPVTVYKATRP
ncbi:DUF1176 domain-containing protein [Oricola indica]|jgi:hypothetical protein|uniref:DUF1176 domain-containing protein n=1 Tax=Oricola indica TaxID=2872591 RepID=UPI001CBFC34D|nr:DUF1176 domain-containing protein [Oricola indica]